MSKKLISRALYYFTKIQAFITLIHFLSGFICDCLFLLPNARAKRITPIRRQSRGVVNSCSRPQVLISITIGKPAITLITPQEIFRSFLPGANIKTNIPATVRKMQIPEYSSTPAATAFVVSALIIKGIRKRNKKTEPRCIMQ